MLYEKYHFRLFIEEKSIFIFVWGKIVKKSNINEYFISTEWIYCVWYNKRYTLDIVIIGYKIYEKFQVRIPQCLDIPEVIIASNSILIERSFLADKDWSRLWLHSKETLTDLSTHANDKQIKIKAKHFGQDWMVFNCWKTINIF